MATAPGPAPRRAFPPLLALPALLWVATLVAVFGFLVPPGPGSAANWFALVALALCAGGAHAALLALGAAAARGRSGRPGAALDVAVALAAGAAYAFLALSLVKFVIVHAHLNAVDLRFLTPSWAQVAGEGTAAERRALGGALLAPFLFGALLLALLRIARRGPAANGPSRWRAPCALLGASLAATGALVAVAPAARWAASTLLPEPALARFARDLVLPRSGAPARAAPAVATPAAPGASVPLPLYRPSPPRGAMQVVVVMLESVPWKRLFGPEARPASTPNLNALAAESIVFERAYAASVHSDYAQTAILASLHPRRFERHDYFAELAYPRALPWDLFGAAGWRTGLFSTQNERWGNMYGFTVTPSLGTVRHAPDFPDAPHRGEGSQTKIFEETAVRAFLAWLDAGCPDDQGRSRPGERERPRLESGTSPFVAVLNFQATHYPYVWPPDAGPGLESDRFEPPFGPAPLDFDATFLGYPREKVPVMLDRFHNALAYADLWVGRLVAELRARSLWETTALVVVADHGEAFYEHGVPTHGTTLHDEQLRVPMLVRLPPALAAAHGAPRVVREPVATLDLLPTLYRALGLPRHGALQGRDDLLEPSYSGAGRPFVATIQGMTNEDALVLDGWKLLVNRDRNQAALYRLAGDPDERGDRLRAEPERARELLARLDALIATQLAYYRERAWERGLEPPRLP